jgi:serine/threonine protein kinase
MSNAVPRPGDTVAGRYRIDGEIGHGGFGAVYQATQLALGRPVALKMLLPELVSQDEGLSRFRREAQLAQRLEHPNTVRLYDFGQTELGLPYIAFELLRGESLDRAIFRSGGGMPPARVARIATQVLKSLMEAHGLGIIHRDIKPANVFLCEFTGEADYVKVLDFGIAKSTSSAPTTMLTQAGHAIGTPNYMSPEQVRGQAVTPAADLYSVGLMMAEMLSGQMVFKGTGADVYLEQLAPTPVPLPLSLGYSPLAPIITRAVEKDVSRRYATASDMLRDLDALIRTGALEGPGGGGPAAAQWSAPPTQLSPQHPATVVLGQPARAVPKSGFSALPIIVAVIVALIAGAAGAVLLLSSGSSSDAKRDYKLRSGDDDEAKGSKKKPRLLDDDPVDAMSVKGKLEKLGWKINGESTSKQNAITVSTVNAQKGSNMAFVYVYEMLDETTAKTIETSLKSQKGSAVKRDRSHLVWVMTYPADAAAAKDLLDDLGL